MSNIFRLDGKTIPTQHPVEAPPSEEVTPEGIQFLVTQALEMMCAARDSLTLAASLAGGKARAEITPQAIGLAAQVANYTASLHKYADTETHKRETGEDPYDDTPTGGTPA